MYDKYITTKPQVETREYGLWRAMKKRCSPGNPVSLKFPTYALCTLSDTFNDFQLFAQWCNSQEGFLSKDENGRRFQLDKDLLIKGNKLYSENTCIFIPARINTLILNNKARRGKYPVGVSLRRATGQFMSGIRVDGVKVNLGYYNDVDTAFRTYKEFKEDYMRNVAEEYKQVISQQAYNALKQYKVDIND